MDECQDPCFPFIDELYCEEEHWEVEEEDDELSSYNHNNTNNNYTYNNNNNDNSIDIFIDNSIDTSKINYSRQDLCYEDEELSMLLSKERGNPMSKIIKSDTYLSGERKKAVNWMVKVHAHYTFSIQTLLMAVNYFDRFMFSFEFQIEKQWMTQLAAVACLSIAAKVEETLVPSLLDFQVEESKHVFEAKTIQRMEILVLSTLEWKMNPVTPYSILDYLTRRLGLKDYYLCLEMIRRCERVLLSTVSDSRFMCYLPSEMAAAIIALVDRIELCSEDDEQKQVLDIPGADKEKIEVCRQLILEIVPGRTTAPSNKRKLVSMPASPSGVVDVSFSSDSSNDSWAVMPSVSSSPVPLGKKMKIANGWHSETCGDLSGVLQSFPSSL